jgi:hypothetical protein
MAFVFLTARDRALTNKEVEKGTETIYQSCYSPKNLVMTTMRMRKHLEWDRNRFHYKYFSLVGIDNNWASVFYLPLRYENKLPRRHYTLGQVGYFDVPDYVPKHNECSPLMDKSELPIELRHMILDRLLVIGPEMRIVPALTKTPNDLSGYDFSTPIVHDAYPGVLGPPGPILAYGQPAKNFFALAGTNKDYRGLVFATFYGKNKISIGQRGDGSQDTRPEFHLLDWLKAIGPEARYYLKDLSFALEMGDGKSIDRPAIRQMVRLLGESRCHRSLPITNIAFHPNAKRHVDVIAEMTSWLTPLQKFRGLTTFAIPGNLQLEGHFRDLVTQPKDLEIDVDNTQPAYMLDNQMLAP